MGPALPDGTVQIICEFERDVMGHMIKGVLGPNPTEAEPIVPKFKPCEYLQRY